MIEDAEVLVVTTGSPEFRHVPEMLKTGQILIDLIGVAKNGKHLGTLYEGICW